MPLDLEQIALELSARPKAPSLPMAVGWESERTKTLYRDAREAYDRRKNERSADVWTDAERTYFKYLEECKNEHSNY